MKKYEIEKEDLVKYVNNGLTNVEIAKIYNCTHSLISFKLKQFSIKRKDLIGEKFGRLLVLENIGYLKNGRTCYSCRCDCGTVVTIQSKLLKNNHTKSCGCIRSRPEDKVSYNQYCNIRHKAKHRKLDFTVSFEYLERLYDEQNQKCKLSGLDISFSKTKSNGTASLDRIDSSKGYIEGNVQWVHKHINQMKWNFKEDYFISLCSLVAKEK